MKKSTYFYIAAGLLLVLFIGCRSTKKLTESKVENTTKTEVANKVDVKEETVVNNDKTTFKKTTITETQFDTESNQVPKVNTNSKVNEPAKAKRVVKAIKVTVIEEGTADKTATEIKKVDNSIIDTKALIELISENKVKEQKKVPVKWGWIFGVLIVVIGGTIYLVKSPAGKTAITLIKKLFSPNKI